MKDHDRLFKELISTFFLEFLELFFTDVLAYLEGGSIEFLDKEIFTDVTSGARLEPDLVAKVRFKGSSAFFLIHVESQAQPQGDFGRRLFRYFSRLYDKYELPVYPIVIFSFDSPRTAQADTHVVAFPNKTVMEFRYDTVQLNRLNWRDFLNRPNPVAAALMAKMDIARGDRARVKLQCLRLLATLKLDRARMSLISGFIDTYLDLSTKEQKEFEAEVGALAADETESVMEIVTSWMRKGLAEGRREGRTEGRREGIEEGQLRATRTDVVEILQARFKRVPGGVKRSLSSIQDRKTLKLLLRHAATVASLKEFQQRLIETDQ